MKIDWHAWSSPSPSPPSSPTAIWACANVDSMSELHIALESEDALHFSQKFEHMGPKGSQSTSSLWPTRDRELLGPPATLRDTNTLGERGRSGLAQIGAASEVEVLGCLGCRWIYYYVVSTKRFCLENFSILATRTSPRTRRQPCYKNPSDDRRYIYFSNDHSPRLGVMISLQGWGCKKHLNRYVVRNQFRTLSPDSPESNLVAVRSRRGSFDSVFISFQMHNELFRVSGESPYYGEFSSI